MLGASQRSTLSRSEASSGLSKLIMRHDTTTSAAIAAVVAMAPAARRDSHHTFLGNLIKKAAEPRHVLTTVLPEAQWIRDLTSATPMNVAAAGGGGGGARVLPADTPTRADVYHLASSLDAMLGEYDLRDPTDATDVLLVGLMECARIAGHHIQEVGHILLHLASSVRDMTVNSRDVVAKLKYDLHVARSFDPAERIQEMQDLLFAKEVALEATQRDLSRCQREREHFEAQAATAEMWKKSRDELADCLRKLSRRNAQLLEIEMARVQAERDAMPHNEVNDVVGSDEDDGGDVGTMVRCDRAVQFNSESSFDASIAASVTKMSSEANAAMDCVEKLCAPFYNTSGRTQVSRPASLALSKLEELAKRAGESDQSRAVPQSRFDKLPTQAAPALSRQTAAALFTGCEEAMSQVRLRLSALAERTDIRKLAYPLAPPESANEPCALCNRTEVDPALLTASREIDVIRTQFAQQAKTIELLHAERLALSDELELMNARFARRREYFIDTATLTDPVTFDDGSPPLVLNLVIQPATRSKPGGKAPSSPRLALVVDHLIKSKSSTSTAGAVGRGSPEVASPPVTTPQRAPHQPQPQKPSMPLQPRRGSRGGPPLSTAAAQPQPQVDAYTAPWSPSVMGQAPRESTPPSVAPAMRRSSELGGGLNGAAAPMSASSEAKMDSGETALLPVPVTTHRRRSTARSFGSLERRSSGGRGVDSADMSRSTRGPPRVDFELIPRLDVAPKQLSWTTRLVSQTWRFAGSPIDVKNRDGVPSRGAREAIESLLYASLGDRRLVAEAVVAFVKSLQAHRADGRAALMLAFVDGHFSDHAFEAVCRFAVSLDNGAGHGNPWATDPLVLHDVRRRPSTVPTTQCLAALTVALPDRDTAIEAVRGFLRAAKPTPHPTTAAGVALAATLLQSLDESLRLPQNALYFSVECWRAARVVAAIVDRSAAPFDTLVAGSPRASDNDDDDIDYDDTDAAAAVE